MSVASLGPTDLSSCTVHALLAEQETLEEANPVRFGMARSETEILINTEVVAGRRSEGFVQVR